MAFSVPTFRQLLTRVRADFGGFTDGTTPVESVEFVLATIQARLARGLYGFLGYILRQAFPDSADETYFWRWLAIFGLDQKQAVRWEGTVTFSGTNGVTIPAGTQFQRSDGSLYETASAVVISGGTATIAAYSLTADAASTLEVADEVELTSPLINVSPDAVVASVTQTGTDDETAPQALIRLLSRLRNPPSGGGPGDYVNWALELAGTTRAWEFANIGGVNTVSVAYVRDGDGDGANILPDAGERASMLSHLLTRVPITVTPLVIELTASTVDVDLTSLTPDTPETLAAVNESLADLFERVAAPGSTLPISKIREAISGATGETDYVLSSPTADLVFDVDEMPIFGSAVVGS